MRPRHIHIVDHDPAAALMTHHGLHALLGETVDVSVAPSPEDAWLRCVRGDADLLIVDPRPGSSAALRLIQAVRTYRPGIPILILTAYDTPGLRAHMRALGVKSYVAKPVDLPELVPLVHAALPPSAPPLRCRPRP